MRLIKRMYFRGKLNFLSNFYYSLIELEGLVYPSVENAFQAMKDEGIRKSKKIVKSAM